MAMCCGAAVQVVDHSQTSGCKSEHTHAGAQRCAQSPGHAQRHDGRRLLGSAVGAACEEGSRKEHGCSKAHPPASGGSFRCLQGTVFLQNGPTILCD